MGETKSFNKIRPTHQASALWGANEIKRIEIGKLKQELKHQPTTIVNRNNMTLTNVTFAKFSFL